MIDIGSSSVTCHPTQVIAPHLNPRLVLDFYHAAIKKLSYYYYR